LDRIVEERKQSIFSCFILTALTCALEAYSSQYNTKLHSAFAVHMPNTVLDTCPKNGNCSQPTYLFCSISMLLLRESNVYTIFWTNRCEPSLALLLHL